MATSTPVPGLPFGDIEDIERRVAAHRHGRVPRELRLEQVLAVAAALFAEEGQASMDELARRAGVSKPVVYDLVGSKDELVATLTERLADELRDRVVHAVATEDDPAAQLRAGVLAFFRFVEGNREGWDMLRRTDPGSAFAGALDEVRRRQSSVVADLLAVRLGGSSGVVAEALAHALNGASEALAVWWLDHPELSAESLADLVATTLSPGIDAISTPTTSG